MRRLLLIVLAVLPAISLPAQEPTKPVEASQPRLTLEEEKDGIKLYQNVPKVAKNLVLALRKLETKVAAGMNYGDYSSLVQDVHADVTVFAESDDAKSVQELAVLLMNASRAYTSVRRCWNRSLFGDDTERVRAKELLEVGRPMLWKLASLNSDAASVLAKGEPKEIVIVLSDLKATPQLFDVKTALKAIHDRMDAPRRQAEEERAKREADEKAKMTPEIERLQKTLDKAREDFADAQQGTVVSKMAGQHGARKNGESQKYRFKSQGAKHQAVEKKRQIVRQAEEKLNVARKNVGLPPVTDAAGPLSEHEWRPPLRPGSGQ